MRTCQILGFLLLTIGAVLAAIGKHWPLTAIAAGLAVELVPAVFQLTN